MPVLLDSWDEWIIMPILLDTRMRRSVIHILHIILISQSGCQYIKHCSKQKQNARPVDIISMPLTPALWKQKQVDLQELQAGLHSGFKNSQSHVCAGNQTWLMCKSNKCPKPSLQHLGLVLKGVMVGMQGQRLPRKQVNRTIHSRSRDWLILQMAAFQEKVIRHAKNKENMVQSKENSNLQKLSLK